MTEMSDLKARVGVLEKRFETRIEKVDKKFDKGEDKHDALSDKLNEIHVSVAVVGQSLENADNIKEGLSKGGVMAYGGGAAGLFYGLIEVIKMIVKAIQDVV